MILINDIGLIGDFVNSIPVMIDLSFENNNQLQVEVHKEALQLFNMIPKKYNIELFVSNDMENYQDSNVLKLDIIKAFQYSVKNNLHMSQCYHHQVGLKTPNNPIKPQLEFENVDVPTYDYILAPFSRSLPVEQLWQQEKWHQLVSLMPDKSFALFGNSLYDNKNFIDAPNVNAEFDRPFVEVCNIMKKSISGVISVVTGIQHLAYALSVKNYVFINQGSWGKNPDGIYLNSYIPNITVNEVFNLLISNG